MSYNPSSFIVYAETEGVIDPPTADRGAEKPSAPNTEPDPLLALLAARRFDPKNPPPPAVARFKIGDATIVTAGNLTGLQAQVKAGKTAFVGAMIGATMAPSGDCLGVSADNSKRHAIVHFDTEQAPADHHAVIAGSLRRAGRTLSPDWLRSYRLADVPLPTRQRAIVFEMERAAQVCGGIFCVILDGLADFCVDPNDSAEAFGFIDALHQLAIRFDTSIICIIHENPSSEAGKTRGHLGSQLERKAETNLRLSKDSDGVTTVFTEKARHAHIPKERGSRFVWSDEEKMHVSTDAKPKGRAKAFDASEILELMRGEFHNYASALELCIGQGWRPTTFKSSWSELKRDGKLIESVIERGRWGERKCA